MNKGNQFHIKQMFDFVIRKHIFYAILFSALLMLGRNIYKEKCISRGFKSLFCGLLLDSHQRWVFCTYVYSSLIVLGTVIDRQYTADPLIDWLGDWTLFDGTFFHIHVITNLFLLFPLVICIFEMKKVYSNCWGLVIRGALLSFAISCIIELIQLLGHLGTFQFSDVFYNACGGGIGGLVYWGMCGLQFDEKNYSEKSDLLSPVKKNAKADDQ